MNTSPASSSNYSLINALWPLFFLGYVFIDSQLSGTRLLVAIVSVAFFVCLDVGWWVWYARTSSDRSRWWGRAMWLAMFAVMVVCWVYATPYAVVMAIYLAAMPMYVFARLESWLWSGAACLAALASTVVTTNGTPFLIAAAVMLLSAYGRAQSASETALKKRQAELDDLERRQGIAADVHDVLGQHLTAITVKAELAERLLTDDPARAAGELRAVQRLARTAVTEVRAVVADLKGADLDQELANARELLNSVGVALHVEGTGGDFPPERRELAAHVLRELVTNVVRHAKATSCVITFGPDGFSLSDDGVGGQVAEGAGLSGVRHRVNEAGARCEVSTSEAGGLQVWVAW